MKRILSLLTAALMLGGGMAAVPASAEGYNFNSDPSKDYAYYFGLSDYDVYKEYCETVNDNLGEQIVQAESVIPNVIESSYQTISCGENYIDLELYVNGDVTEQELSALLHEPAQFGFPESWYAPSGKEDQGDMECLRGETMPSGEGYTQITLHIAKSSQATDDVVFYPIEDELDAIRMQLTLYNSAYVRDHIYTEFPFPSNVGLMLLEEPPVTDPTEPVFGDVNGDGAVNANDAACILRYSAAYGAKNFTGTFEEYMQQ